MTRLVPLLVLLLVAGCRGYEPHGTVVDPPLEVPTFTLLGDEGEVSREDFEGQIVVLFFGFTACPDVCPDTLVRLRQAIQSLTLKQEEQIQVILVSVDPERDSPEGVARYARRFYPSFVGLSGTASQIERVATAYGIYHAAVPYDDRDGYTVDHTAHILVLDRSGDTVLIWPPGTEPEAMASDLRFLLRRS